LPPILQALSDLTVGKLVVAENWENSQVRVAPSLRLGLVNTVVGLIASMHRQVTIKEYGIRSLLGDAGNQSSSGGHVRGW